jgi:tripartite-type tricarboxylate transporter receptor subunit TctC
MEKLQRGAGIKLTHIPYKGGAGQMIPAILAGETPVAFLNLSSALPHIKAGKMKALATTAPARLAEIPEVATMAEQGFAGIGTNAWQAMFAPAKTPRPVIAKLHKAVSDALSRPEMKEQLAKQMLNVALSRSPEEFDELVRKETQEWAKFLREANIRVD